MSALAPLFAVGAVLAIAPSSARGQDRAAPPPRLELERTLTVPGGITVAAAFAPNGATLCTGGEVGDVVLWDVKTGAQRWRVRPSDYRIGGIAWPPAGDRVAVLGSSLTVHDAADGRELLRCEASSPHGLAFSPDGSQLAFLRQGSARVIALPKGEVVRDFNGRQISCLAFSSDGAGLFAGDDLGRVWRLSLRDCSNEHLYTHGQVGARTGSCVAVAACGDGVLSFGCDGEVRLGARTFASPSQLFLAAATSGGDSFAAGAEGCKVTVWQERGAREQTFDAGAQIAALAFHPDGSTLAVATYDGALRLVRDGVPVRAFAGGHVGRPQSVAWSADSTVLAIGGARRTAFVDRQGKMIVVPEGGTVCDGRKGDEIFALAGGRFIARSGRTGEVLRQWPAGGRGFNELVGLSPDGAAAFVSDFELERTLRVDLADGTQQVIGGDGNAADFACSATGALAIGMMTGNQGEWGNLQLFDAAGQATFVERKTGWVATVAFSPDGSKLAYTLANGWRQSTPDTLRVRDVATCKVLREVQSNLRWLRYLDDRTAIAHDGAALSLWDTERWEAIATFPMPPIWRASLSPDGSEVAVTTGADVRVVRVVPALR